jgi:hypothetical protein
MHNEPKKKELDFRKFKPILGIIITSFGFLVAIGAMALSLRTISISSKPLNPDLFKQFLTKNVATIIY